MKVFLKVLYAAVIVLGLAWFFVVQLPLLMTAGSMPALFGLAITVLIVAVVAQLVYNKLKGVNETTTNKENPQ